MPDPYAPHHDFIHPATRATQLWRVVLVLVGFEIIFALSPDIVIFFFTNGAVADAYIQGTTAFGTLAQFLTFGIGAAVLVMLVNLLHGRGFWSLIGPAAATWRNLVRVCGVVALVVIVQEILPPWYNLRDASEVRPIGVWLLFVPLTLAALLVQVGTEEMLFRGYLQQQLASLTRSRWVWMGVPSLLFGGLHYWNGHGPAEGVMWAFWASLLGLACADLTARSGNLGAAIGLHLVNNAFALLLFGTRGVSGSGVALFLFENDYPFLEDGIEVLLEPWALLYMLVQAGSVFVMWLGARVAIRR